MIEVSMFQTEQEKFLKLELKQLDTSLVQSIMGMPGWFKGKDAMTFGLPFSALGDFMRLTKDKLVIWKSQNDKMGAVAKGIDTRDIPSDFIVDYSPTTELRPHQIKLFNLLMMRDHLLVADQEGVGKTYPLLTSIEAKIKHGVAKWAVWVTKAGLIYDVLNQAKACTNLNVMVLGGTPKKRIDLYAECNNGVRPDLVVVSYDTYRQDINQFANMHQKQPFDIMICDEAHKVKEPLTRIGKIIHALDIKQRYAVTASPIINEILDMYNIFHWMGLIRQNLFMFKQHYCELDQWGNVSSYKNLGEIKALIQTNMVRRLKTDVLKDLPPVIYKNVYVELTPAQKRIYKMVEDGSGDLDFEDLFFEDVPSELAKYARLMQIAISTEIVGGETGVKGSAKLKEVADLLGDIVERGEKAVVFTPSKRFAKILYDHFPQYNPSIITGDVNAVAKASQTVSDRQEQVDKFQNDESCKVIFCSAAASREGWTATSGSNIIFIGKEFSPAYQGQAIGRVWRYGAQKHKAINVYSIIARGTIDERIENLLESKQDVINNMVETPLSTKEIMRMLEK